MPNPTEISLLNYNFEAKACNELLPLVVHKCALHEKAMKGMKNSSPPPLHFLHIGIGFFLHCL